MWPANWCVRVSDQSLERAKTVSGSQTFVLGDVVFAQDEELDWPVMGVSCRITGKRDDHRSWQMGFHSKSQFWILLMGGWVLVCSILLNYLPDCRLMLDATRNTAELDSFHSLW